MEGLIQRRQVCTEIRTDTIREGVPVRSPLSSGLLLQLSPLRQFFEVDTWATYLSDVHF